MRFRRLITIPLVVYVVVLVGHGAQAALTITVTGSWGFTIDSSDLSAGAGSDLTGSYESSSSQVDIDVGGTIDNDDNWRVDVSRSDTTWDGDFVLSVKRTSDGTGGGAISNGTSYQTISMSNETFFSGRGDRTTVLLQLMLSGVSVQVPPNTYSTTITYTVVDI